MILCQSKSANFSEQYKNAITAVADGGTGIYVNMSPMSSANAFPSQKAKIVYFSETYQAVTCCSFLIVYRQQL